MAFFQVVREATDRDLLAPVHPPFDDIFNASHGIIGTDLPCDGG
jgi:hypothetical protein